MTSRFADLWRFRRPVIEHWLEMVDNAGSLLARPSPADWRYNREHVASLVRTLAGGDLERLQRPNPAQGFVSTPVDGIGAAFTETGRICSLLFPYTAFTPQIPYYVAEANGSSNGRMEGSFGGILHGSRRAEPTWLWADAFDTTIDYESGSGILSLSYRGDGLRLDEAAYVYPGSNTLVRDFVIENVGTGSFDGAFVYHTRANVTDEDQTFVVWHSHPNRLTGDGGLRWADLEGPYALGVWGQRAGGDVARSTGDENRDPTTKEGRYLDGRLRFPFALDSGESTTVSVFVGDARGGVPRDPPGPVTAAKRQATVRAWWREWLADVDTDGIDQFEELYVRSVILLASLFDPETGSVAAAPNLQPMYYPSWIRDNAFVAVALARAGKPGIAKSILGEFCPSVQEVDGSFKQCYNSRGEFAGVVGVENDQQPLYVWAVSEVYDESGDDAFAERAWPAVGAALDYTIHAIGPDGLLSPSLDIAEYPEHVRQSLWTNTFAYRGLLDGAKLADVVGANADRYREAAYQIGDAVQRHFFERVDGRKYLVVKDANGGVEDVFLYDAAAIHPTEWALDYDEIDRLQADLLDLADDDWDEWIPGSLMTATAFAEAGSADNSAALLESVARETTAAGHLKEMPSGDGDHYFASPLAWSHAAFVLAVTAGRRESTNGSEGEPTSSARR